MANAAAWFMFFLGFAHIAVGLVRFKGPLLGVTAFPRSPFWAPLLVSPVLVAAGYGLV